MIKVFLCCSCCFAKVVVVVVVDVAVGVVPVAFSFDMFSLLLLLVRCLYYFSAVYIEFYPALVSCCCSYRSFSCYQIYY